MPEQYFPRAAAVKASRLTANTNRDDFLLSFNRGRTTFPFLMDNGTDIFLLTAPGTGAPIPMGGWLVEAASGVEVHADPDFRGKFCAATP